MRSWSCSGTSLKCLCGVVRLYAKILFRYPVKLWFTHRDPVFCHLAYYDSSWKIFCCFAGAFHHDPVSKSSDPGNPTVIMISWEILMLFVCLISLLLLWRDINAG